MSLVSSVLFRQTGFIETHTACQRFHIESQIFGHRVPLTFLAVGQGVKAWLGVLVHLYHRVKLTSHHLLIGDISLHFTCGGLQKGDEGSLCTVCGHRQVGLIKHEA